MIFRPVREVSEKAEETIAVTKSALEKLALLADIMHNLEFRAVSGALKTDSADRKTIVDFIVAHRQDASGGTCAIDEEGEFKTIQELKGKDLLYVGIAHGHGSSFSAFHSGYDNTAIKKILNMCFTVNRTKKIAEVDLTEMALNLPAKVFKALDKAKVMTQLAYEKSSYVSSIVVNYNNEYYAELDFEDENMLSKDIQRYKKVARVEEVANLDYTPLLSRADAVKELVTKVFFPRQGKIPSDFKKYEDSYRSIKSDRLTITFADMLTQYLQNPESMYTKKIQDTLKRIDARFAERIKFMQDTANPEVDKILLSLFRASRECPDWFIDFMDRFAGSAQHEKERAIEDNLNRLSNLYLMDKPKSKLSFEAKIPAVIAIGTQSDDLKDLENLYKSKKDTYIAIIYGFTQLANLVSKEFTFDSLNEISEARRTLRAIKFKALDKIYDALAEKKFRLNDLLAEKGYVLAKEIILPQIKPAEVYEKIEAVITAEARHINFLCNTFDKLNTKHNYWTRNKIERFAIQKRALQKELEKILSYQKIISSEDMEKLHTWNAGACNKPTEDFLRGCYEIVRSYKKKKEQGRLSKEGRELLEIKKDIHFLDKLDAAAGKEFREHIEKIKKEYEAL